MAYRDLSIVNISLQTTGVTSQGFGTPIFISSHRYFPERVRSYTSLNAAADDLPTDSPAYAAVREFFSNTPSVPLVKVGRREADLDLTVASGATSASLTFFASDGTDTYSLSVDVSGEVDQDAVATAIAAAIEGDADIGPLVDATATTNVVSVTPTSATDTFWVQSLSNELTESYTSSETAADVLTAVEDEDNEFYFVTAEDHTETFVLAMANEVEARLKLYFTSSQEQGALSSYTEGSATDVLGKIRDNAFARTKGFFHHQADSAFPECTYVGYNAPFLAGSVVWTNLTVNLPVSQDPATGKKLTATQKGNLEDRRAAFVDSVGGVNYIRQDETADGTPIDFIRGRDNYEIDLNTAFTNLLFNQKGGKLTSVAPISNTFVNVTNRYVARGFIEEGYEQFMDFPDFTDTPVADQEAGIYRAASFKCDLVGAIKFIGPINGTLAIDLQV